MHQSQSFNHLAKISTSNFRSSSRFLCLNHVRYPDDQKKTMTTSNRMIDSPTNYLFLFFNERTTTEYFNEVHLSIDFLFTGTLFTLFNIERSFIITIHVDIDLQSTMFNLEERHMYAHLCRMLWWCLLKLCKERSCRSEERIRRAGNWSIERETQWRKWSLKRTFVIRETNQWERKSKCIVMGKVRSYDDLFKS
jgi:hypothetical protein